MKAAKTTTLPLTGKKKNDILRLTRRALMLKDLQSFAITMKGIEITRLVEEEEPVFEDGSDDVDVFALIERLQLETHPFDPKEHGTHALYAAVQKLVESKNFPVWIFTPSWALLSAWLDVPMTDVAPAYVYGLKLAIVPPKATNGRVLVVGSSSNLDFLSDATVAVAIDMGV